MNKSKYDNVVFQKLPNSSEQNVDAPECNIKASHSTINSKQLLGMLMGFLHYLCGGILSGYSSVLIAQLNEDGSLKVTESQASWIASIAIIPMAPSCLLVGFLLNKIPKKALLIIITLVEIASWATIYFSTSIMGLLIGRALNGISSSMGSPIIPTYLGEITHPNMRGVALSMILFGLSAGILSIHTMGAFFSWKTCALITTGILLVYFCIVIYSKETFAWHLRKNNKEAAKKAFIWYRGENSDANEELKKLLRKQHQNSLNEVSKIDMIRLCSSKLLLMPLLITLVGMFTMHFSGNKAIMFYSISIVSKVIPSLNQYTSTIIVDIIRLIVTIISCFFIKRFPFRYLFIISGTGSAFSHICFAAFTYYSTENNQNLFQIFALMSLLAYIIFSTVGIAPLVWVFAGELFPLIVKGIGSGLACFFYFMSFFIVVKMTPDLFGSFGLAGGFLFFGGFTVLGTVIMYFILPETKNKTLEEIEDIFK